MTGSAAQEKTGRRERWRVRLLILAAVWLVALLLLWIGLPGSSRIVVSRETTYLTGPLNPDGTVSYVQHFIDKYGEGVTPENNAAVLLFLAFGPHICEPDLLPAALEQLGMPEDASDAGGPCFVDFEDYWRQQTGSDDAPEHLWDRLVSTPWSADEYPMEAAWLAANERPLDLVVEASRRQRYFDSLVGDDDPPVVASVLLPLLGPARRGAQALAARAMLRLEAGDLRGARSDLLAIRRLGRLVGQSWTFIHRLVAVSVGAIADSAQPELLKHGDLSEAGLRTLLDDLNGLDPLPPLAETLQNERLATLDMVMACSRGPLDPSVFDPYGRWAGALSALSRTRIDWNEVLRELNQWHDRVVEAAAEPDFPEYLRKMEDFERDRLKFANALLGLTWRHRVELFLARYVVGAGTRVAARALVWFGLPDIGTIRTEDEKGATRAELLKLAIATMLHKADHGDYPADLDALGPDYLDAVPKDRFTGDPLHYERLPDGFRIYSVGPNMIDDGGREDEDRELDDILIEIRPGAPDEDPP